ncbi:DNA adenine methylase [Mesorhizobium sp.]|uniref:DNA adenine methylase n=1 Tax=Mesorhizobium sp. TaxID=1871066 RepID=UPI000FE8865B|nr:DNA adenine methylase [Mesorhizobium sp.]RWE44221.1 MAG: DNA adenine methylase [Mesorhizobium sp.]
MQKLPHPIPYQGSKRSLAPLIAPYIPSDIETWYEPFAGSAAMTLWAANRNAARHYVIGDVLAPIADLWRVIIERPKEASGTYAEIWHGQTTAGEDYFNAVRDVYNETHNPVALLYLIARCVKNAVRFNRTGKFTQSRDKRRLGMQPEKMAKAILGASMLLKGKTEVITGDWRKTLEPAGPADFVYMDPPYLGTTIGRDKRYAEGLQQDLLIAGLADLRERDIRFALSYDGMTGGKEYGPPLPDTLGLNRLLLHAGKSSQATLVGRSEETVESLYLSPGLGEAQTDVIRRQPKAVQESFTL